MSDFSSIYCSILFKLVRFFWMTFYKNSIRSSCQIFFVNKLWSNRKQGPLNITGFVCLICLLLLLFVCFFFFFCFFFCFFLPSMFCYCGRQKLMYGRVMSIRIQNQPVLLSSNFLTTQVKSFQRKQNKL